MVWVLVFGDGEMLARPWEEYIVFKADRGDGCSKLMKAFKLNIPKPGNADPMTDRAAHSNLC